MIEKEKKLNLFRNNFIIDSLLKVLENYSDVEVVRRGVALLTSLLKDSAIVTIFKELKGLEVLASIMEAIISEDIKGAFFVCFKLLSEVEYDLLGDMQNLGIVEWMIDELEKVKNPYNQIIIL